MLSGRPRGGSSLEDHFDDLLLNSAPELPAVLGIEQDHRTGSMMESFHIAQRDAQFLQGSSPPTLKSGTGDLKPLLAAVATGRLKHLAEVHVGGHGLIGDSRKLAPDRIPRWRASVLACSMTPLRRR